MKRTGLLAILSLLATAAVSSAGIEYEVIPVTADVTYGYANGVNSTGQVAGMAGYADAGGFGTGPRGGSIFEVQSPFPFSRITYAQAINDAGEIAGRSWDSQGPKAFYFDPISRESRSLGMLPGGRAFAYGSEAYGISSSGRVVGWSDTGNNYHAFMSDPHGGALHDLGTLQSGNAGNSIAWAVSRSGRVTGSSDTGTGVHAFLTGNDGTGRLVDVGDLDRNDIWSEGLGVNDAGQVVGDSLVGPNFRPHAFITGVGGVGMTDLGLLHRDDFGSRALAINNSGIAVGVAMTEGYGGRSLAFIYRSGRMIDLNDLVDPNSGYVLTSANAISDTGYIAVTGYQVNSFPSHPIAFLLSPLSSPPSPTPEPSSVVLALLGIAAGVISARRSLRQASR